MREMKRCEGNLPADVTGFIGRRRELHDLRALLTASRLVTLTGVGGVGKTRMALKVAAEARRAFQDGAWFVELATLQDASLVADMVTSALGVIKHTTKAPSEQLADYLADKHLLIVLDNCEHLSEACATLVGELLRSAPMARFLVTSRHSLGVLGEQIFTVPPMSTPSSTAGLDPSSLNGFDAVALLCARASDSGSGFRVTQDNSTRVARLCEHLDGIPLAIELAAARLRTLTVADVLDRLDRRFQLLSAGNSAALPRHQTLQALIDWSYALCSPKEQTLWARLSVFAGSFSLSAVEAVCTGEGLTAEEMIDLVDALVRKSILIAEPSGEQMRYRLLETVREYGSARLATTDASTRLQRAHRDYFGCLAERSFTEWCGPEQAAWVARLREDHGNLRAAFDRCMESGRAEQACALAAALQWYWIAGGSLGEGRRWLGQVLAAADPHQPRPANAAAMWVDAYLALLRGELAAARAQLDEAERLAGMVDAPELPGYLAQLRGMAALFGGELDQAKKCYESALASHEERGDAPAVVSMLFQLAVVCLLTGEHDQAAALCERSLRLSARYGERWAASYALWALALNKWSIGDCAGADELAHESLRIKRDFGDHLGIAHMIELLAWIAASDRRFAESARLLGTAHTIWHSLGTSMAAFGEHLANCHTRTEKRVREALGASAADALIAKGAAQGIDLATADLTDSADTPNALQDVAGSPLTARELQVAGLVASGKTNRQIAAELVLSSRTIDSHVQHILTKFGFTSRSQIAAWFAQHSNAPTGLA